MPPPVQHGMWSAATPAETLQRGGCSGSCAPRVHHTLFSHRDQICTGPEHVPKQLILSWSPGGQTCWCHVLVPRPVAEETWTQNGAQGMGDCCCSPSRELHCLLSAELSSLGITLPMHTPLGELHLAGPGLSLGTGHGQMLPFAGPRQEGCELQPACHLQSSQGTGLSPAGGRS